MFPVVLSLQGEPLVFTPPVLLSSPFWPTDHGPGVGEESILWRRDVEVILTSGKSIRGWFGILESMSRSHSGFFLHYRGKGLQGATPNPTAGDGEVIEVRTSAYKPKSIFGQSGGYRDQNFIGEFDVSAFGKSITTDSVQWSPEEEDEFVKKIRELMCDPEFDFWNQALHFRRRGQSKTGPKPAHDEFTPEEFGTSISVGLDDANLSHGQAETPDATATEMEKIFTYRFTDIERHDHVFEVFETKADLFDLYRIELNRKTDIHKVIVDFQNPAISRSIPIEGSVKEMLLNIVVGLAVAEVLDDTLSSTRLRLKFNEVLHAIGHDRKKSS